MASSGSLTANEEKFVVAVIGSNSILAAADAAGISERSGYRYMARPRVKRAISERLESVSREAVCGLVEDMLAARRALRVVVEDPEVAPGVRVRAADIILRRAPELLETVDLMERLTGLEARIDGVESRGRRGVG